MTMRIRTRLAALAMVGIMRCWSAYGQTATLRAERELFASVNQARLAQGLSPLRWDESLATAARRHAEAMAEHGSAQHGFEGEPSLSVRVKQAGAHFTWLSENVTQGPSPMFIHTQFMKSPHIARTFWTGTWIRLEWAWWSRAGNCSRWRIFRKRGE